jgi:hypothetical protein
MSYWSLEFNAQIAGNSISRVLIFKILRGCIPPDPPRTPRAFAARSMTKNFWLAARVSFEVDRCGKSSTLVLSLNV